MTMKKLTIPHQNQQSFQQIFPTALATFLLVLKGKLSVVNNQIFSVSKETSLLDITT